MLSIQAQAAALQHQQALAAAQQNAQQNPTGAHQQLQHLAAVAAAAAAANPSVGATQAGAGTAVPSLAWPIFQPTVSIPYFDMATYQKVNLDVQPSAMANGMDLPLNDINTLR